MSTLPAAPRRGAEVTKWLRDKMTSGYTFEVDHCLQQMRLAAGIAPHDYTPSNGRDPWAIEAFEHAHHAVACTDARKIPSQVYVYFRSNRPNRPGHICWSPAGGSQVITTDIPDARHFGYSDVATIERVWGMKLVGYSYDLNEHLVGHLPVPAKELGTPVTVATNNIMSLPKNKQVAKTLASTPTASVVGVQEADIFHAEVQNVPGYDCPPVPHGDTYDSVILSKPTIWRSLNHEYYPLYDGVKGISKSRHIAVERSEHLETSQQVVFISYHDVTKGEDSLRKGLRRKGRRNVRKVIRRHRALGQPVVLFCDANQNGTVYRTANVIAKHGIDHVYAWNGKHVTWKQMSSRAVATDSDHHAWIVKLLMKVK